MRYKYSRKNKYNNQKYLVNDIKFDSKKEAIRYLYLKSLEDEGKISDLKRQVPFIIQDSYIRTDGKLIRPIKYIADFTYTKVTNGKVENVVEDVKGVKTDVYKLKKKLVEKKYDIIINEVY